MSRYRQTQKPLPEIARELRVDALLEGSVARSGDRVRITAKLFQAAPERQLLSESYEFDARDVVAVQAEVARDVATRARIRLTPQEQARLATARRVDPEAYEAYLLGRAYFSQWGVETPAKAKAYYEKSIAKDPTYAPAYASLAELYTGRLWAFPVAARAQARQLAEKALALDDSLPKRTPLSSTRFRNGIGRGGARTAGRSTPIRVTQWPVFGMPNISSSWSASTRRCSKPSAHNGSIRFPRL
jgi:tetratricopeptide (TPR) repeat protein